MTIKSAITNGLPEIGNDLPPARINLAGGLFPFPACGFGVALTPRARSSRSDAGMKIVGE